MTIEDLSIAISLKKELDFLDSLISKIQGNEVISVGSLRLDSIEGRHKVFAGIIAREAQRSRTEILKRIKEL